jgi:hypothetical protein
MQNHYGQLTYAAAKVEKALRLTKTRSSRRGALLDSGGRGVDNGRENDDRSYEKTMTLKMR